MAIAGYKKVNYSDYCCEISTIGLDPDEEDSLYRQIFRSNIQLLGERNQEKIRRSLIYAAGIGGVGSHELITAARQGFTKFVIADPDIIESRNIQRQAHARHSSVGRKKTEVISEMLLDIFPYNQITLYDIKIDKNNVGEFLSRGEGIAFDGIDF